MKIASSDVYSNSNYCYQKDLSSGGAGTGGFFAGIVENHVENNHSVESSTTNSHVTQDNGLTFFQ